MSKNPEPPQKSHPTTWSPPNNLCMLTVDLENDCGGRVGPRFDTITEASVRLLVEFIRFHEVPVTFFVTAKIFEEKKREVELLQAGLNQVEFAVHSYSHPNLLDDYEEEIAKACSAYERFFGCAPAGYRAPQGRINESDFEALHRHGFVYDSSIFPTVRPGVFDHAGAPTEPYYMEGHRLVEIPCSIFPRLNIPVGMGYFRMLGPFITKLLLATTTLPRFLVLGFHLHDAVQTEHTDMLPPFWRFFYRRNVRKGFALLGFFLNDLKRRGYEFGLMKDIVPLVANNHAVRS